MLTGGNALRELARFAARADARDLPAPVAEKAKACLLYALAVGAGGMRAVQPACAAVAQRATGGGSTRFFDGASCDAAIAAFGNGTLLHARVQDDAHPAGHVGVVVVPAGLAAAESAGAAGRDLLAALVAGYEVALRIGRDHAADSSARGFRTTPLYGVFGAAAAAGRLVGLDHEAMTHALSLAANTAGGLREYAEAGSEDFPYQAGFAAGNGIAAARLAAAGATSGPSVLDGKAGFYRGFGEGGRDYASRVAERLGERFEMMAITYKPYPICQFHRGVVRGFCALRERACGRGLVAARVRMHPFEADFFGVRYDGPFATFPQTFMSVPFCAGLAWSRGDVTLAGLTDFDDQDVLSHVPRIEVISDPRRDRYAPAIEAHLSDGTVLEWQDGDAADAYRLTWETAHDMAARLGAEAGVDLAPLATAVDAVDEAPDVAAIVAAMRGACVAAAKPRKDPQPLRAARSGTP